MGRRRLFIQLIWGLLLISLTSCGMMSDISAVEATPLPNGPRPDALGGKQDGDLYVWIYSNPFPPIRGRNAFEAYLGDENGQPITDAKLSFDLDMTNMSHGKNIVFAEAFGDGFYAGNVSLIMPGPWRVIVTIEYGGQTNAVRFNFNVK